MKAGDDFQIARFVVDCMPWCTCFAALESVMRTAWRFQEVRQEV
jgi:hypothetical protein